MPVRTAPGQQYGMAGEQRAAQQALPMGPPPAPAMGAPGPGGPAGATPAGPPPVGRPVPPVTVVPLTDPTARPGEPVTAGVPVGAGPGPEALGLPDENGVEDLALYLPMLEWMASQPGASAQTRNFVRRLRGAAPIR